MHLNGKVHKGLPQRRQPLESNKQVTPMAAQDLASTSATAPLVCTLRVRYGECDPQGVVFNAHFLAYFDIGMTELSRAAFGTIGGYQAMVDRSGAELVVAEAGLRYHRP